jgi:endogenous inhibitor of DNA gyrase (YacG/DUF329 family)
MTAEVDQETPQESALSAELEREYWGWDHHACITLCVEPPRRKHARRYCPGCGGKVVVREMSDDIEPEPGWFGALLAGIRRGKMYAERVTRQPQPAPAVTLPCPICDADEWKEVMAELISQCGAHEGE